MERYSAIEGRTPEVTVEQARKLLASIEPKSVRDLRDRALIATLIYTAARAGAVAKLRLKDFVNEGTQFALKFSEKGGKARSIPAAPTCKASCRIHLRGGTGKRATRRAVVPHSRRPTRHAFRSAVKRRRYLPSW